MSNSGTMSRWTCEHCGHKNKPEFGNCTNCLRGFDEDFTEPNWLRGSGNIPKPPRTNA